VAAVVRAGSRPLSPPSLPRETPPGTRGASLRRVEGPAAFAGRGAARASAVWIAVDNPDCRRTVILYWGADSHLSTGARLMRTAITSWDWVTATSPDQ
jgi:hypothetical protein